MKVREILKIAITAGDILLSSGAEIYRVEDTIRRICRSYGVDAESFVTPTGIFISTIEEGFEESNSLMKRISTRSVDLHKIELINTFSRSLEKHPLEYNEAAAELKRIQDNPSFNFPTRLICAGITAFVYTLIFNGTVADGFVAFFICWLIYIYKEFAAKTGFFQMFDSFICGMIAGGIGILVTKFFPVLNLDSIIIGSIMILVPGLIITGGIKDAIHGDMITSTARLCEALLIVISLGAGVAIVLSFKIIWM